MEALYEYNATAFENGKPAMFIPRLRALHAREAAAMAINWLRSEGGPCTPDTPLTISDVDSRGERTLTIAECTHRPD